MSALDLLESLQLRLRLLVEALPETRLYRQAHPDLSPLGWHLGHCVFIESYWIRERILGHCEETAAWHSLYFPDQSAKAERGAALPAKQELLSWSERLQAENLELLREAAAQTRHSLLHDDYLPRFLCGHHAQHLETMRMALARPDPAEDIPKQAADGTAAAPGSGAVHLPAGRYPIGNASAVFDNERPPRETELRGCRLARRPVSAGDYLEAMADGLYQRAELWCEAGRRWLRQARARAPDGWLARRSGWHSCTPEGVRPLVHEAPVSGLSWYEADAYARWRGARLPHEYEWEAAARAGQLENTGQVWEWCGNRFHPYPGFRAFPYEGYSLPWFDGEHYVLRGASRHTEDCIRSPSFRNFYTRDKRHIFAGCRLAWDAE